MHSSIVIDSSDSWESMKIVNEYCVKKSIPLISASVVGFDIEVALFENKKNNHLCLNCLFPNKNDVNLPRCDTVGISGIAAGMAGLIAAQKTVNYLINLKKENLKIYQQECPDLVPEIEKSILDFTKLNLLVDSYLNPLLKENIQDAGSQWDDVKSLRLVNFYWKDHDLAFGGGPEDGKQLGWIAQEVQSVSPLLVDSVEGLA